jgi:ubiquinone/menaquinone biosynthesis C-methylase UbiE
MGFMGKLLGQCRKPTGWFGGLVARGMNISHAKLTDWDLRKITVGDNFTILDIGCGGGGTISKLAAISKNGKVYGIDYSEESIKITQKKNKKLLQSGKVELQQCSVEKIPSPNNYFDLVTAIETHYFWPELEKSMKEVVRTIKPGGILIIIGGEYRGGKYDERNAEWVKLGNMAYYNKNELNDLLLKVGLIDIKVLEEYEKGWICAIGKKPTI